MSIHNHISVEEKSLIEKAIEEAELNSSGEIRVHMESKCKEDILDHAAFIFRALGMYKTKERNAILFYIALTDHKFAVIGDQGIHEKVGDEFWRKIKNEMLPFLKKGEIAQALVDGIGKAGQELKHHFPYQSDDENELNNEISFS